MALSICPKLGPGSAEEVEFLSDWSLWAMYLPLRVGPHCDWQLHQDHLEFEAEIGMMVSKGRKGSGQGKAKTSTGLLSPWGSVPTARAAFPSSGLPSAGPSSPFKAQLR